MEQHGYITFHKGWKDAKGFKPGRASLVLPTDKLVALYDEVMEAGFEVVLTEHAERELVILKDRSGSREDYIDTPETNLNRERLQRMNAVNLSHCWRGTHRTHGCVPVHPSSLVLERQFNDRSLKVYGRLHCAAQAMPAVQRWTLTIDAEETTELDYRCMHIALAYAEVALWDSEGASARLVWPTDAYHVEGFIQATAKAAMMRLLNASSRDNAVLATMKLPSVSVHADAVRLLSRLEEKHAKIKEHFYGGGWKTLSLWEANIMCSILDRCIELGVPLLPIHDGVVCRKSDREAVLNAMEQAVFREYQVMPVIAEVTSATGAKVNVSTTNRSLGIRMGSIN
ncbi:hypothetical protein Q6D67_21200 [Haliea sp. E1-2-M8]|uniref:hypothetical protein n=1 Tax=Haliea sp. E1-2-M8 TaxID=3064706 RepID=UPI00271DF80B|nr:hypothetical protein [Haliea sp. E1-2-M8]MDO8864198.1 hypothetical protein [Haliea sp. E1-2-M8]